MFELWMNKSIKASLFSKFKKVEKRRSLDDKQKVEAILAKGKSLKDLDELIVLRHFNGEQTENQ